MFDKSDLPIGIYTDTILTMTVHYIYPIYLSDNHHDTQ